MTQQTPAPPLGRPFDQDFFQDPYPTYARLRSAGPVHRIALPDGSPVWLVTRERDVRAGLTDTRLSVNKAHSTNGYQGFSLPPALDANLLNIDPDDHLRLRRLVSKGFTPRHVEQLRARVAEVAGQFADRLAEVGQADLVTTFAHPLPLVIIGDLLAVPEADSRTFSGWVAAMFAPEYPGHTAEAIGHIHRYLLDLISARRAHPADDLLSSLIAARDDGARLSEDELVSLAFLILMAGSENTQHLISGGLLTLLRHPDQLTTLRARPELMPEAVEELFRFAHPNQMAIRRFPTEPVEIGGVRIPTGDTVLLALASAHRDPSRYPEPDRFDIHRADKTHLALGHGVHYCLGAALARLEIRTALSTLLDRFPGLRLAVPDEQLEWRASFRSHALKQLPVAIG
ncbi:cytochrome P450 [Streptomyces sioyaensis]|uniref:Cytochrome P450 n=1 Tax=Streptomyces sioyaensis TaxID=67364 RepID=A0A4Q1QWN1_9ACTN|nr:cytochrome P450 [Streptomyces sioyaensis]MBM4792238.1 cytochrome P450 [Streptomyces sioyaensis]RXS67612.1 cytochrome P450 [Streptomyces sioyaensis]